MRTLYLVPIAMAKYIHVHILSQCILWSLKCRSVECIKLTTIYYDCINAKGEREKANGMANSVRSHSHRLQNKIVTNFWNSFKWFGIYNWICVFATVFTSKQFVPNPTSPSFMVIPFLRLSLQPHTNEWINVNVFRVCVCVLFFLLELLILMFYSFHQMLN